MMETVASAVSGLRSEIEKRNEQIRSTINALEREVAGGKVLIDQLMNDLVAFEMAGDDKSQAETEKKLVALRGRQQDIQEHLEAYKTTLADPGFIRPGLQEIFKIAADQQAERMAAIQEKSTRAAEIEAEFIKLRDEVQAISTRIRLLNHGSSADEQAISSLLRLIEARPVEPGNELAYLQAFAAGRPVDAFLPQQKQQWAPPEQQFGIVTGPKQPQRGGQIGEARSLCRGEHTNAGHAAGEN
jgi:chromosome segregation ATPase